MSMRVWCIFNFIAQKVFARMSFMIQSRIFSVGGKKRTNLVEKAKEKLRLILSGNRRGSWWQDWRIGYLSWSAWNSSWSVHGSWRIGHCVHSSVVFNDGIEIGMFHGFHSRQPFLVIVSQKLVQKVQCLRTHQMLVFTVDETFPSFSGMSTQDVWETRVQFNLVFV